MADPKPLVPANEPKSSGNELDGQLGGTNVSLAPPEFILQVSGEDGAPSGDGASASFTPVQDDAAVCIEGDEDPISKAINMAHESTKNGWSKKKLRSIEPALVAVRNILQSDGSIEPVPGSKFHPDTYNGWEIQKGYKKAIDKLFKALHSGDSGKKRLAYLRSAQSGLKGLLRQVKAFTKGKDYKNLAGFNELQIAVDAGINEKLASVKAGIVAGMPVSERPATKRKFRGGVGGSKGFNKQKISDQTQLPGLAAPTAAAPVAGSISAKVEENMSRDFEVTAGSVEDVLYVNLPDLVAGKGKIKGASKAWYLIRNYRNKVLNPLYGEMVKHPDDPAKKEAYEQALVNMEKEIGPEVRKIARGWWAMDLKEAGDLKKESGELEKDLLSSHKGLADQAKVTDFDPATVNKTEMRETLIGIKKRIQTVRLSSKKVGLEKVDKKAASYCLNKGYTGMKAVGKAMKTLKKGKLKASHISDILSNLNKAIEQQKLITAKLNEVISSAETKNKSIQHILDRINDPEKTPLIKEVKKHRVAVRFKGDPDNEVNARYGTKPESRIGIYENVWSPLGISDKKGKFNRPKGGERGAQVYRDLKTNHGFPEGEAKVLGSVAVGEGDFHSLNSVDIMRISLGFIQFAGASFVALLGNLKKADKAYFVKKFEQYGIIYNNGTTPVPKVTTRNERFVPGADIGKPKEESKRTSHTYKKLVVYDHQARIWVQGKEAMAVLQSDPRYLTLIQSSAGDVEMKLAQVKRARNSYLHPVRKASLSYADLGLKDPSLPEGSKKKSKKSVGKVADFVKSEVVTYAGTAKGIGAGPSKGKSLIRKFLKMYVKHKGITTIEELKKINQGEFSDFVKEKHKSKTWARPKRLGEALGNPLDRNNYIGNP